MKFYNLCSLVALIILSLVSANLYAQNLKALPANIDKVVFDYGIVEIINSNIPGNADMRITPNNLSMFNSDSIEVVRLGVGGQSGDHGELRLVADRANVGETAVFLDAHASNGGVVSLRDGDVKESAILEASHSGGAARLHLEGVSQLNQSQNGGIITFIDGTAQHLIQLVNDGSTTGASDDASFYLGIMKDKIGNGIPIPSEQVLTIAYNTGGGEPTNAEIVAKIDEAGNYTTISDIRLKENINTLTNVLPSILSMRPSSYNFKKDVNKKTEIGFLAQDVKTYFPQLVDGDDTVDGQYMMVNYQGMIPVLTKAIQEQHQYITAQREEIEEIKSELAAIKELLKAK